jgi:hypothetical protein
VSFSGAAVVLRHADSSAAGSLPAFESPARHHSAAMRQESRQEVKLPWTPKPRNASIEGAPPRTMHDQDFNVEPSLLPIAQVLSEAAQKLQVDDPRRAYLHTLANIKF